MAQPRPQPRHRRTKPKTPMAARVRRLAAPTVGVAVLATAAAGAVWSAEPVAPRATAGGALERPAGTSGADRTASPAPPLLRSSVLAIREQAVSRSEDRSALTDAEPDGNRHKGRRARPEGRPSAKPSPDRRPRATPEPEPEPEPVVVGRRYMTAALNVWSGPGESYTLLDVLPAGTRVAVTGRVHAGQWAEVVLDGTVRWVNADYLSVHKPRPPEPEPASESRAQSKPDGTEGASAASGGGLSSAPCPSGSSPENGMTANAIGVHRAVCAAFPEVTTYGGYRAGDDGAHGEGRAVDVMVSSSATGDQISEWVRARASQLHVSEVIWAQHIWTVQRSSQGWRWMEDRGSPTANHYDHVHVTVY